MSSVSPTPPPPSVRPSSPKKSIPLTTTTLSDPSSLVIGDISSPHQLVDWVDHLLVSLEKRFDEMNSQVTTRMNEMSNRIDALETSIQDLIHGTIAPLPSPSVGTAGNSTITNSSHNE